METQLLAVNQICPSLTRSWIKRGALVIDVREEEEVKQFQLEVPSVLHIPLSQFDHQLHQLPLTQLLVLVCNTGENSLKAASMLLAHGFDPEKVVSMKFGITRWVQKGYPVIGNTNHIPKLESLQGCCNSGKTTGGCC